MKPIGEEQAEDACEGPQYFVKDSRDLAWEPNHTASRVDATEYSKQK